jgi:hypothetical protein
VIITRKSRVGDVLGMSIAELKKLVPPPAKPFEVGTLAQWRKLEERLGVKLPRDYREFVFAYGSGLFAGLYRVYNPFAASPYLALLPSVERVCGIEREGKSHSGEKYFPSPIYPEPGGLLPWGNDENGNDYYWRTEGPPTRWIVVQNNNRGEGLRVQPYSMTGFLVGILRRKIRALASGYPRKEDYRFEPWDTRKTG